MDKTSDYRFWGEYEHGTDDKGRVIIPQDFREALGDEFVVTRAPDRAIFVFPLPVWRDVEQTMLSTAESSFLDQNTRFLQRLFSGRTIVKLDPQFRLAIPKPLREWAEINTNQPAVILGQIDKLEIWSKSNWDTFGTRFTSENVHEASHKNKLGSINGVSKPEVSL